MRVLGVTGTSNCRYEITINGSSCPSGPLIYDFYAQDTLLNHYRSQTVVGYCEGVGEGVSQSLGVSVGQIPEFPTPTDCHTGFRDSTWVLEVEEIDVN